MDTRKTRRLDLSATPWEYEQWQEAAAAQHLKITDWARAALRAAAEKQKAGD